jgi:hypothetical protein
VIMESGTTRSNGRLPKCGMYMTAYRISLRNRRSQQDFECKRWCAIIRSRLEYGCEVVITSPEQLKILERMQMDVARVILGCNRKAGLETILGELKIQPLEVRFAKYHIRLLHEIVHSNLLPLVKRVWNGV